MLSPALSRSLPLHRRRTWRPWPGKRPGFARDTFFADPAAVEADYRRFVNDRQREPSAPGRRGPAHW
jgi:hypothetical protein